MPKVLHPFAFLGKPGAVFNGWPVRQPKPPVGVPNQGTPTPFRTIEYKYGGYAEVVPPDPIPNSEVKYFRADDSFVLSTMRK